MRLHTQTRAVVLLLSLAGCAHARPERTAPPVEPIAWPAPPAAPRVRLLSILPDPNAPAPSRPWWRVALDWITGAEDADEGGHLLPRPFGATWASDGSLWVADPDGARVVRFDSRGTASFVTCPKLTWGAPMALTWGADGALYVADAGAGSLVRWTPGGCTTLGAGSLERPTGVAAVRAGLWVTDPPRHQVVELTPQGEVVRRLGQRGEGDGAFNFPSSLATLPDGRVAVVDSLNFRVVLLDPEGRWVGSFGERGDQGGQFSLPKAISISPEGGFFVTDAQRDLVLVFGADGTYQFPVGGSGTSPGQFTHPAGVAQSGGRLAVTDSYNHRVQLFELLGGTP